MKLVKDVNTVLAEPRLLRKTSQCQVLFDDRSNKLPSPMNPKGMPEKVALKIESVAVFGWLGKPVAERRLWMTRPAFEAEQPRQSAVANVDTIP